MTRITVDSELRNKLLDLSEPPLSEKERARRQQESGFTTDEVLARLKRL